MPDSDGRRNFRRMWDMAEYTKDPFRYVYLRPNGSAFTEDILWQNHYQNRKPKRPFRYHQKIRTIYLTEAAYAHKEPYVFHSDYSKSHDLYLQFANIKTRNDLDNFIEKKKDFCIFPDENDIKLLRHYYQQKIETEKYNFSHTMNEPLPKDVARRQKIIRKKIRKINLDYLWEKKEILKILLDSYRTGELKFFNFSYIHYFLEQSSEMLIDKKYYDIAKIEASVKFKYPRDRRSFDEILGDRKIDDSGQLVPGYRVYGHFALCCLQFYLLVKSEKSVDICPLCKNYFKKEHKAEIFCDNCKGKAASKRSLKYQKEHKE